MNALTVFNNSDFGQIRATKIEGKPWFVGKDVAEALGYSNPVKAITAHVREKYRTYADKTTHSQIGNELGQRGGWLINENGLYELIMKSEMETAEQFQEWVYESVLPSIRKNGGYVVGQEQATENQMEQLKQLMAQAMNVISQQTATIEGQAKVIEQKDAQIEADAPKVAFAEAVESSETEVPMKDIAKVVASVITDKVEAGEEVPEEVLHLGKNKLYAILRDRGVFGSKGAEKNRPKEKYYSEGLFKSRVLTFQKNGVPTTFIANNVTGKGIVFIVNMLCGSQTARAG